MKSSSFLGTDYTEKLMFTYTKNHVNPCNPCLNIRCVLTDRPYPNINKNTSSGIDFFKRLLRVRSAPLEMRVA